MNESLEPEDLDEPQRRACAVPPALPITYDDELDVDDAAFRYVVKHGAPSSGFGE